MKPCDIWIEQCQAARRIEDDFGTQKALEYLVGEKFINFLEAAETRLRPGAVPRRSLLSCRSGGHVSELHKSLDGDKNYRISLYEET